ncbi:hypothetical protein A2733_00525 [Candidatus Nomurabacteria bacterium RIFCSPHIGHO2_01_FULL_40_20]|uniref:Uncharacterized protein n=1 Tax=Candidatus Nomurabacteria bacterium RIFCSPHIGHO2_01_FULL_40_20 TaxID=1801738 RepID=A0A1F6V1X2_9BACT|nr:MAG: hypothetical protein A2733_00525 [Candidatus Nomurabacteria bacterium RIFCSPHIGHO2_01_FULL_40_20]
MSKENGHVKNGNSQFELSLTKLAKLKKKRSAFASRKRALLLNENGGQGVKESLDKKIKLLDKWIKTLEPTKPKPITKRARKKVKKILQKVMPASRANKKRMLANAL